MLLCILFETIAGRDTGKLHSIFKCLFFVSIFSKVLAFTMRERCRNKRIFNFLRCAYIFTVWNIFEVFHFPTVTWKAPVWHTEQPWTHKKCVCRVNKLFFIRAPAHD